MTFADQWSAVTDAVGSGSFDPQGLNFNATAFGVPPQFSAAPTTETARSPASKFQGLSEVGSGSGGTGAAPNATVGNQSGSDVTSAAAPGSVQNYFMRGLVIVTGFIFLAVGLSMLRPAALSLNGAK